MKDDFYRESQLKNNKSNRPKYKNKKRLYRKERYKNDIEYRQYFSAYHKDNKKNNPLYVENRKANSKRHVDDLKDDYIIQLIKGRFKITTNEITPHLIESYRLYIQNERMIKNARSTTK